MEGEGKGCREEGAGARRDSLALRCPVNTATTRQSGPLARARCGNVRIASGFRRVCFSTPLVGGVLKHTLRLAGRSCECTNAAGPPGWDANRAPEGGGRPPTAVLSFPVYPLLPVPSSPTTRHHSHNPNRRRVAPTSSQRQPVSYSSWGSQDGHRNRSRKYSVEKDRNLLSQPPAATGPASPVSRQPFFFYPLLGQRVFRHRRFVAALRQCLDSASPACQLREVAGRKRSQSDARGFQSIWNNAIFAVRPSPPTRGPVRLAGKRPGTGGPAAPVRRQPPPSCPPLIPARWTTGSPR